MASRQLSAGSMASGRNWALAGGPEQAFIPGALGASRWKPRLFSHLILWCVIAFFAVFIWWAQWATLDEVSRGEGRVIPSRQVQIIQNLEGGILAATLVREGDLVDADQVVARIDNIRAASGYRENVVRYYGLLASVERLQAEIEGRPINFPADVLEKAPDVAQSELSLFQARQEQLDSQIAVLRQQVEQRQGELNELATREASLTTSLDLAQQEFDMAAPLAARGVFSKMDTLRLRRQVVDLQSNLEQTKLQKPRAESALREANHRIEATISEFRSESLRELTLKRTELQSIKETVSAGEDQVRRTEVRSPVRGVVKQIKINTVGGVLPPGGEIMEIVPIEDTLLVEAMVRPSDIAFLRPGLPATVKITAYDYSIYGGMHGRVEDISADTLANERGETFFRVRVRTDKAHLGSEERPLEIIPGMTAQVDIMTGKKTVMDYLLKPILKARTEALRER
ncbi:MAG TPA: HlyD family type I secretion periplasmic adaptor subunit [Geminicoccus sp.]|uniref:HlyD family type I secretion periplasmic adaptor subunit n=1 Tax=Geminicoccus sp. TaxID=2024832 RepID=UPI002E33C5FE|nr:HlyD family type I secretion periplasmic adaptor subunit [Geminicoccus sp.]HEX2525190.1 HlyD family type I secretion periplasmic adaptor subunit [Geminicoccus sp.]